MSRGRCRGSTPCGANETSALPPPDSTRFVMLRPGTSFPSGRVRRAVAAVEFAVVSPLLATLLLGMLEIGRGLMVKEALSDAAQKACRTAALPGKANSDVQSEVDNIMSDN